jgi:hypothetical protein
VLVVADAASTGAVVAACAGAFAAAAAWVNVWIGRRQWLWTQRPNLRVVAIESNEGPHIDVHITNAGPGVAIDPAWAIVLDNEWTGGWASPSRMSLLSGESIRAKAGFSRSDVERSIFVLLAVDSVGVAHLWDRHGNHRVLRSRWLRTRLNAPLASDALKIMEPDLDLDALRKVPGSVPKDQ